MHCKNSSKALLTNILAYGRAGIIGRIFRAAQEFSIRFLLPPEILGAWSFIMTLVNFSSISELGVFSAARRELPILYAKDEYQEAAQLRSITFSLHFAAKVIMGITIIIYCLLKNGADSDYLKYYFAAAVLIVLAALGENFSCFFETAQEYKKLSKAHSYYWPSYAIVMTLGAYLGDVAGLIIANMLLLLFQGWLMRSSMTEIITAKYRYWNWSQAKVLLATAIPFFITDFPINLMYTLDSLLVAKYFSVAILAIYTTAKMLALQAGLLPMWINNVLEIRFTSLNFQQSGEKQRISHELFHYLSAYFLIFMPLVIIGVEAASYYFIKAFLPTYQGFMKYLPFLTIALYLSPKLTPLRNFLVIDKKFKKLAYINYCSLAIMLAGFAYLVFCKHLGLINISIIYSFAFLVHFILVIASQAKKSMSLKQVILLILALLASLVCSIVATEIGLNFMLSMETSLVNTLFALLKMIFLISPMCILGLSILMPSLFIKHKK